MALPTGSVGQSWRPEANDLGFGQGPVYLALPVSHSGWYKAPLGLYYGCAGDDELVLITGFGFSASLSSISVSSSGDGHYIDLWQATTAFAGFADTVVRLFPVITGSLGLSLGEIEIWYAFSTSSYQRKGIFVTDEANPHLSLVPYEFTYGDRFAGDWYLATGSRESQGVKIFDRNSDQSLYTGSLVAVPISGSVSLVSSSRFAGNYPLQRFLAARGFVSEYGLYTVVSGGTGPLVENASWSGGFYMPNLTTISLTNAGKVFLIPSGNVYLTSSLNLNENRIYIRGNGSTFIMSGVSSSAFINEQAWTFLTSSAASVVNIITGEPAMPEGAFLYVIPVGTSIDEAHVRTSGNWYQVVQSSSFDTLDGGTY